MKEFFLNFAHSFTQATYPKVQVAESPKIESTVSKQLEAEEEEDEEEVDNNETGDDEPIYVARSTMTCEEDFVLPAKEESPCSESEDYQSDEDTEEKESVEGETEQRNRDRNRNEHNPPKCRRTCTFEECIENLHRGRPVHYCSGDASPCERNKCPVGIDGISHNGSREFRCMLGHWGEEEVPPQRGSKKRNRGEKESKFPSGSNRR